MALALLNVVDCWCRIRDAAHRLPLQCAVAGVVDQTVEDGFGHGRVADCCVPAFRGQLAGDDRGAVQAAVLDHLEDCRPSVVLSGLSPQSPSTKWLRVLESLSFEVSTNTAAARLRCVQVLCWRLRSATEDAQHLSAEIESLVIPRSLGLTRVCGIDVPSAGALAGILGPGDRFGSDAQLAAYAGVAPLEASSAGGNHHRLNRGGNRHLDAYLHWYNEKRIKMSLGGRSPLEYRQALGYV